MATLNDVIKNNLQIPYEDLATSQLAVDTGSLVAMERKRTLRLKGMYS